MNVFICALAVIGLYAISRKGYLLNALREFLNRHIHPKYLDPVINCCLCMSSLWGTAFLIAMYSEIHPLITVVQVLSIAGMISIYINLKR